MRMSARAVQISLDEALLRSVDSDPEAKKHGRSHLVSSALRMYLSAKKQNNIDEAIRRAYTSHGEDMLREFEGLIEGQAWPTE